MTITRTRARAALTLAGILVVCSAAPAAASPVTVNLRIEGSTSTLFEGSVTTDVRPFHFTSGSDTANHACDNNAGLGGSNPSPTPEPTRGAAVAAAEDAGLLTSDGTWYSFGASFSHFDDQSVAYDSMTNKYLVEYKNWISSSNGACADPISDGDQALFAYGDGSETLLRLTGPTTVAPNQGFTVTVHAGASSSGVAGSTVGGQTTMSDGTAVIPGFTARGDHDLKATKSGAFIRSNRLRVCVTDGADGYCGTTVPAPSPPLAPSAPAGPVSSPPPPPPAGAQHTLPPASHGEILTIHNGMVFAHGHGPRILSGDVTRGANGLSAVRLRLERTLHGHCQGLDGRQVRFVPIRCGVQHAPWVSAGHGPAYSYLLPSALRRGRYVLDVEALDITGQPERFLVPGRNRVVFYVG